MARLNVQAWLIGYLQDNLPDVAVRARVPEPRPTLLVVVRCAGGRKLDALRDSAGVHLMVYGGSEWETSELASEVSDLMWALNRSDAAMLAGIDRVDEEAMRSEPDTQAKPEAPRWFCSYTLITHRYPS